MILEFIESKVLELKKEYSDTLLKTISAFSNCEGGKIIIGIDEFSQKIVGVDNYIQVKLNIENKINDTLTPRPNYELNVIFNENKTLIEIVVYKGLNTPYLYKGIAYQRKDTSTVPVDQKSLIELSLQGKNISYDQLEIDNKGLKFQILEEKLKEVKSINEFNNDILMTLGLYSNNKYNIAASLFSDENKSINSGIDIVRFGSSISEFTERKTISNKSILIQYDESINMFLKYFPEIEIVEGLKRIKKQPIPFEAFRETVANALAHRDYIINAHIKIEMYDNRIEVISPGGLPNGITSENYLKDNLSIPRNIVVSYVLYALGIIERFGTGIKRINNSYIGYNKKPKYIIKDNFIKVILPNIIFNDENMNDEARVINMIDIKVDITRQDVENLLNITKFKAIDLINKLIDDNRLEQLGSARNIYYRKIN